MPRQFRQPIRPSIYDSAAPCQLPDTSTPLKKALIAFEDNIRHDSVETGAFFNVDGVETVRRSGQPDRVSFDDVPIKLLLGMSFSHNHPLGGNFSADDLCTASSLHLVQLRVVTAHFRFSLRATARGWPSPSQMTQALAHLEPQAQRRARLNIASGQTDLRNAQAQAEHELLNLLALEYGLIYSRLRS